MKKLVILSIGFLVLLGGCAELQQLMTLTKCEFRTKDVQNVTVAGIEVQNKKSLSDFDALTVINLTRAITQKKLPLQFTYNVEARNPNPSTAAMTKCEWIALINDKQLIAGAVNQKVEIPSNGGTAVIPITVQADLFEVFKGGQGKELLGYGLGLKDENNQPTQKLTLKLKPTLTVAGMQITYPGYITINKQFKSQ